MKDIAEEIRKLLAEKKEGDVDVINWVSAKMEELGFPLDYVAGFRTHPSIRSVENMTSAGQRLVVAEVIAMELVEKGLHKVNTLNTRYILLADNTLEQWMVIVYKVVLPDLLKLIKGEV